MIRVERINTDTAFQQLAPIWNQILEASASNTLTLTFEWLSCWWQTFKENRGLYILLARDGEAIIGIAPLLKRAVQHLGVLPYQRLEFLASGEDEADEICSDYLDFICVRGRETDALTAIVTYLNQNSSDWDEILLTDISGESINLPILEKLCEQYRMPVQTVGEAIAVYLPLNQSWESIVQNVGSHFRRRIRQDRQVFSDFGGEFRIIDTGEGFAEGFATLIELHQSRWESKAESGVFASPRFVEFHQRFAEQAIEQGWLRLYVALKNGEPFAAIYNFFYNRKVYYYQSGVNIAASGLHSPGILLQGLAIEDAMRSGLWEYDFLKSPEGSYKFKWRPQTRPLLQVRLAQSQAKERVYRATTKMLNGLKNFKRGLRNKAAL
ncbi:MAG: GNAT family N-acetyltransferase [Acidobacteriota bacterium]